MDKEGRGGRVISVSDTACSRTGYSREELLRMNIEDVLSPEGSDGNLPFEINDDGIGEFSSRLKRADGVDIPVDVRVVSIDEGEKLIYMAIIWEKSDPMNSKEETEGNSDLNRAAFMASHDPIMVSNLKDGKIIDVNDAFTPISGWTREEVIGRTTMDIDLWCRIDDRKAYVKELERRGKVRDFQTHLKDRNGDEHPVSLSASIVTVGNERYIVTICRDLKGTWELTRLKDLAFQTLEKDDSMILWIDMEGKVYYVNETVTGYLGYTKKELSRMYLWDIYPTYSKSKLINFLKEVKEKGSTSVETVMKRPDGRTFPAEVYLNHLELDGEEIIFAFVRDISERRRMENLLAKSRMFERGLIDSTLDSLLLINREGVILTCNAVAAERLGRTVEQLIGMNLYAILPDDVARRRREWIEYVFSTGENIQKEDSRDDILFSTHFHPIKNMEDEVEYVSIFAKDITDLRNKEEQARMEKERAELYLDLLLHDIGNIHQGIISGIQLASMVREEADTLGKVLSSMENLAKRSISLTSNILLLSRLNREDIIPKVRDLNIVIDRCLERVRTDFRKKEPTIEIRKPSEMLFVQADEHLEMVFQILMDNALRYQKKDPFLELELDRKNGYVYIHIRDRGPGIDEKQLDVIRGEHLMKKEATRRGLGLILARTLVERYGGDMDASLITDNGRIIGTDVSVILKSAEGMQQGHDVDLPSAA